MNNDTRNTAPENSAQETIFAPFTPDEESPYIFISYAHKDRERVFPIIKGLYEKGWRVWYDEGLEIRENYYTSLSRHIKNCEVFLLFVTENSVKSDFVCEHELLLAVGARKRICICRLDPNAQFTDEAKDAIDIATISKKNPKTDEAGLEKALEGIEGLTKTKPRKAKGLYVKSNVPIASEEDDYEFQECTGGVRLTKYIGSEENVEIPEVYKGQPVVELYKTFLSNKTVKNVRVPATVKSIGWITFGECVSLTDVYIPASVLKIHEDTFDKIHCTIHCSEGTVAHSFAKKKYFKVIVDNRLNVSKNIQSSASEKYAFCSYAADKKVEAERILSKLAENGCNVISSGSMIGEEKLNSLLGAECLIAFVSDGYINGNDIIYLRTAKKMGKSYIIYNLDGSVLPADMDISMNAEQQLRYDNGTEEDRLTKLRNFLSDNGCVKTSADIPDYEYTTDTDGNIILTKYTGNETEVVVPSSHAGHKVVELRGTFDGCRSLTSVTFPGSVTGIGKRAFAVCESMTAVTIPDSVTSIGEDAFAGCESMTAVTIPDSVTSIGEEAFSWCRSLTSVTIPNSVTSIGKSAFRECSSLTAVTIPNSVTSIGDYVFHKCSSLTSVTIPNSVTCIGEEAFSKCDNLIAVTIPDSVTSIGDIAFFGCKSLTSVTIPDSVTSIGKGAFYECESLTAVTISDSISEIHTAFFGCKSLTAVTIPDSVTSIGSGAFYGCDSLTSITIPDSVTSISEDAFRDCSRLTAVTIPDSVTSISDSAFAECEKLTIYCPEGSEAWKYCVKNSIPHKPLEKPAEISAEAPAPAPAVKAQLAETPVHKSRRSRASLFILLALLAAAAIAAGVQLSGLFDILGWLCSLLG